MTRRPTNVPRTVFHVAAGAVALSAIRLLPTRTWLIAAAVAFATFAWGCELLRKSSPRMNERLMRVFGPVAHAHEWHKVNSATWYATALVVIALFVPRDAAALGVVVLAIADPMAGLVGRRFGRHRFASGRSIEGALGFVASGLLASLAWMTVFGGFDGRRLLIAAIAASVGALIELFVSRVDDNFAIPVGSSVAVAAASALLPVL